ncbi:MAG TPA: hypothetical protein PK621_04935 [Syntrophales bacterium]|nr:hypothetical protein [Syntrophales bacterium]
MTRRLSILLSLLSIVVATSLAVGQPEPGPAKTAQVKTVPIKPAPKKAPPRETRMRATGKVIEISPTALKIERNVKGTVETMDFLLPKSQDRIAVGDEVGVSYITKDNQHIAKRVGKVAKKKVVSPPKGIKSPPPYPAAK